MSEGAADVDGDGLIHAGLVLSESLLEVVVGAVVGPEGDGEEGGEEEGEEQSSLHLGEKLTADCDGRGAHRSVPHCPQITLTVTWISLSYKIRSTRTRNGVVIFTDRPCQCD